MLLQPSSVEELLGDSGY